MLFRRKGAHLNLSWPNGCFYALINDGLEPLQVLRKQVLPWHLEMGTPKFRKGKTFVKVTPGSPGLLL